MQYESEEHYDYEMNQQAMEDEGHAMEEANALAAAEEANLETAKEPSIMACEPHIMRWVATSDRVPVIDESNKWNKENKISKDVLCYSEKWGMSFGRYFHLGCFWTINGWSSTAGVTAEYWMEVKPPCA